MGPATGLELSIHDAEIDHNYFIKEIMASQLG